MATRPAEPAPMTQTEGNVRLTPLEGLSRAPGRNAGVPAGAGWGAERFSCCTATEIGTFLVEGKSWYDGPVTPGSLEHISKYGRVPVVAHPEGGRRACAESSLRVHSMCAVSDLVCISFFEMRSRGRAA